MPPYPYVRVIYEPMVEITEPAVDSKGYVEEYLVARTVPVTRAFRDSMGVICGDDGKETLIQWTSHMLQRPDEKPGVALVLTGPAGSGKSTITELMSNLIGHAKCCTTDTPDPNIWGPEIAGKTFIKMEDASRADFEKHLPSLTSLITDQNITVKKPYKASVVIPAIHRLVLTSNEPLPIEDDDRRFRVVACNADVPGVSRAAAATHAATILRELSNDAVALAAIRDYLMKLPLDM